MTMRFSLLAGVLLFAPAALAQERAAQVQMLVGPATAEAMDGGARPLQRGDWVGRGDTVTTGPTAYLGLHFVDGATVFLRPQSRLAIRDYRVPATPPPAGAPVEGSADLRFIKGSFRAVTGWFGKRRADRFLLSTPIASLGIRGTDFGVEIAPDTTSSVFVFEGAVEVANPEAAGPSVLLHSGEMTVVRPLQPPTAATPFDREGGGGAQAPDALERAEDPLLEPSEAPALDRYLALPDADLDAQGNPAYAAEGAGLHSTLALTGGYGHAGQTIELGGQKSNPERYDSRALVAQNVSLMQIGTKSWLGFSAGGSQLLDEATVSTRAPGTADSITSFQHTDSDRLDAGLFGAHQFGRVALGLGVRHNRSLMDVDDRPLDGSAASQTRSDNRVDSYRIGALLDPRTSRTLGLSYEYQVLDSLTRAQADRKPLDGHVHAVETQYRRPAGDRALLGWRLRLEHSLSEEQVTGAQGPIYAERFDVRSAKTGLGAAWPLPRRGVAALDASLGYAHEDATQVNPDQSIREDEADTRYSAALHLGGQVFVTANVFLSLDATQQYVRDDKRFLLAPGTASERRERTLDERNDALADAGVGYAWGKAYLGYFAHAASGTPQPVTHNLYLVYGW